uniref:NADH-ubiquinone oxidoreductase chain 4L n=1 Tax=Anopheles arthuri TaxID=862808 RepID=A0A343WFY4_9DIPT|nr:NADH dehydrogenase subunit 4L [Anopheles arthuri]
MANMYLLFMLSMIMFIFGCLVFVSNRKHLLSTLLSLEFMVLSLFIFLFFYLNFMNYELYFSMFFLTFCVCEGVLGLSILVSMIRTHGNDYFQSFSILQC